MSANPWSKQSLGDLVVYQAEQLAACAGLLHGYTTRAGGVSAPPYDSFNLAGHVGDNPAQVASNRTLLCACLDVPADSMATAEQIHGDAVAVVSEPSPSPIAGVDALTTCTPDVLLVLFYADCVPVYIVDPVHRAIGIAHAGWRGTAAGIAEITLRRMHDAFGSDPPACLAAIGPSIAGESYEVGADVADRFRDWHNRTSCLGAQRKGRTIAPSGKESILLPLSLEGRGGWGERGIRESCLRAQAEKWRLDLRPVVAAQLASAGVSPANISVSLEDTFCNQTDFYSYRRDGITGRNAAFAVLRSTPVP